MTHIGRLAGSHVLATIANKDGQLFAMSTYEVSADGKTLTSRSSGMLDQAIMFDRQLVTTTSRGGGAIQRLPTLGHTAKPTKTSQTA